jgi:hypothetical protein
MFGPLRYGNAGGGAGVGVGGSGGPSDLRGFLSDLLGLAREGAEVYAAYRNAGRNVTTPVPVWYGNPSPTAPTNLPTFQGTPGKDAASAGGFESIKPYIPLLIVGGIIIGAAYMLKG